MVRGGDEGRMVIVVRDGDGVLCSMHLEGTQVPSAGDVVMRLVVPLPVSLAEVGRRCAGSAVGEGTEGQGGLKRTIKTRRIAKLVGDE